MAKYFKTLRCGCGAVALIFFNLLRTSTVSIIYTLTPNLDVYICVYVLPMHRQMQRMVIGSIVKMVGKKNVKAVIYLLFFDIRGLVMHLFVLTINDVTV